MGNVAVHATIVGMLYYKANEAWLIITGTFTPKAVEATEATGVRLINGDELAEWLKDVKEDIRSISECPLIDSAAYSVPSLSKLLRFVVA